MTSPSFFRRELPTPPCIPFQSPQGRLLFKSALATNGLEAYFPLSQHFLTQDEPAYCGVSTLTMVLNSMGIQPLFEGDVAYRESMSDCCVPLEEVKNSGITFDEFVCLARCHRLRVQPTRAHEGDSHIQVFREAVERVCSVSYGACIVTSYSRKGLGQTGDGHFSPIGGYDRASDSVLIMDVARFKYEPHWVPLPLLHEAMTYKDASTGQTRGWVELTADPSSTVSRAISLVSLSSQWSTLRSTWKQVRSRVCNASSSSSCCSSTQDTSACCSPPQTQSPSSSSSCEHIIQCVSSSCDCQIITLLNSLVIPEHVDDSLIHAVRTTPLYHQLQQHRHHLQANDNNDDNNKVHSLEILAIMLLMLPVAVFRMCGDDSPCNMSAYVELSSIPPPLHNEVVAIRHQLNCLLCCSR